jgi:hypothetical protein
VRRTLVATGANFGGGVILNKIDEKNREWKEALCALL